MLKNPFTINIPDAPVPSFETLDEVYALYLILDEEKDEDIIEFLDDVRYGTRNAFLKNLLRAYIPVMNFSAYFCSGKSVMTVKYVTETPDDKKSTSIQPKKAEKRKNTEKKNKNEQSSVSDNNSYIQNTNKNNSEDAQSTQDDDADFFDELLNLTLF